MIKDEALQKYNFFKKTNAFFMPGFVFQLLSSFFLNLRPPTKVVFQSLYYLSWLAELTTHLF